MRRPKNTVDYFPHDAMASEGDTLTLLESEFGNDGYALWFKLLERLARTENHFITINNDTKWQLFCRKAHITPKKAITIVEKLAYLGAIDTELWHAGGIIWSENLVKNVAEVYKNRRRDLPPKPNLKNITTSSNSITTPKIAITTVDTPSNSITTPKIAITTQQSKVKYSIGKEKRVDPPTPQETTAATDKDFGEMVTGYEKNISYLTPIVRQQLIDAWEEYPHSWFADVFKEAADLNKRNWRYCETILKRWKAEGRDKPKSSVKMKVL